MHMFIWCISECWTCAEWVFFITAVSVSQKDMCICIRVCVCESVCLCLSEEGGRGGDSSDKLPHLGRFRRSERSCGEAFISETGKKRQNQDGVSVKEDEKAGERVKKTGGERRKRVR